MNVSLPQELEKRIHDWVAEGEYGSVDEALTAAVQILSETELEGGDYFDYLTEEIPLGLREEEADLLEPLDVKRIIAECRANAGMPPTTL